MRSIALVLLLTLVAGCVRKDSPADEGLNDSALIAPLPPDSARPATSLPNGLVIDSSRIRLAERAQVLQRFTPTQILSIYQSYRPLRRRDISLEQLDSFLRVEKVSRLELRSVLEQGDRLGWSDTTRR